MFCVSWAYRSCPAAWLDPLVGILASGVNFLTRSLRSCVYISESPVSRFSSHSWVSGTVYIVAILSKHQVIHHSWSKVIFSFSETIFGLCSFNHAIRRMISWFCKFATCCEANSWWLPIWIGTFAIWVIGAITLRFPSAKFISLGFSASVVGIWSLLHIVLWMKSSVAP